MIKYNCQSYELRRKLTESSKPSLLALSPSIIINACTAPQGKLVVDPSAYPKTPRDESIVEDHFGTSISDPYRALEDPDAEHTKACAWVMMDVATESNTPRCTSTASPPPQLWMHKTASPMRCLRSVPLEINSSTCLLHCTTTLNTAHPSSVAAGVW